jgi:hypothetical protein
LKNPDVAPSVVIERTMKNKGELFAHKAGTFVRFLQDASLYKQDMAGRMNAGRVNAGRMS